MASGSNVFDTFYKDLKETEKKDSVLTPRQQIDRLLRPGSTYRNLNPYEVLQVDPDLPFDEVKKKFRRLSILVHPDKNQDDLERAQAAFDAVKKAYSLLEDEITRKKCYEIVEEARGRTRKNMEEKRKKLRRDASIKGQNPDDVKVEEDDPLKFHQSVTVLTMKLFADLELKRRQNENKISEDAKKKREQELELEEKRRVEQEFVKNWEESRQGRVNSWLHFKSGKSSAPAPTEKEPTLPPLPPTPAIVAAPIPTSTKGFGGTGQGTKGFGQMGPSTNKGYGSSSIAGGYKPYGGVVPGQMGGVPGGAGKSFGYGGVGPGSMGSSGMMASGAGAGEPPAEKKKKKEKHRFSPMGFRPPKHKPESR